jgi:hypothetical protein
MFQRWKHAMVSAGNDIRVILHVARLSKLAVGFLAETEKN